MVTQDIAILRFDLHDRWLASMTGFSGLAAILHFEPILQPMTARGMPESWLIFPIGIRKTAEFFLAIGFVGLGIATLTLQLR
ncbi:hypothetical protein AB0H00_25795 [Nocardia sp. NPDC023852]|uniref:hypothetical protein n=1 Tax=Nocardia sp. NPDC023852 TaxID=3154697 RepID=UPI0033E55567